MLNNFLQIPTVLSTAPTPPVFSNQNFKAIDENGEACYVTYMYGANQAMAMAVELKLGESFDRRSIDLPSMGALVGFYHACVGCPVKQTWLDAIKAGNFESLPGLTYSNEAQYCVDADKTTKCHLARSARMSAQPNLNVQLPLNLRWCQCLPQDRNHCTKSLPKHIPSASCIRTTLDGSQLKPGWVTSM